MLLSEARFVEIYKKIDGYRIIKVNRKTVKVSYIKDPIVYDTENETSLLWLLRKVIHNGWIPYAKGTMFGINTPLEIDEKYRSGEFENIYEVLDPLGNELSKGLLEIHHKHSKGYYKRKEDGIINEFHQQQARKALLKCVKRYKDGKFVPPTMLPEVLEYIRNESIEDSTDTIE